MSTAKLESSVGKEAAWRLEHHIFEILVRALLLEVGLLHTLENS